MSSPRISVVVPFYNNGDVLGDCLQSIAGQTFTDLEVIMVDDGSTDNGTEVAGNGRNPTRGSAWSTATTAGPAGPGTGASSRRRGEFLAFVDADDMLPPHAYEVLLHTLESSGSDFVSGAVNRISTEGVTPSALHARAIKRRKIGTHMTRAPELLYDISVWNKLFRRSFWDAHQLYYPENMVWEDLQLMTRAHVLAKAVDVIPDYIYYWRERGGGRAVHHPEPHRHPEPARPHHRPARHRRVPARARPGQDAAPAPAQGARQRPLAVRARPVPGQRRLPGRVLRAGELLPGPGRPAGAAGRCPPPTSSPTT